MRLIESNQCSFEAVTKLRFDLCVAASGYESRALFVPSRISETSIGRRVALAFEEKKRTGFRLRNDVQLKKLGYALEPAEGNSGKVIQDVVADVVLSSPREEINILVDYSSMTRVWYGGVLGFLRGLPACGKRVSVYFTYSASIYTRPQAPMPNEHMGPVPGYSSLIMPDSPTALLIGLGYERERALGLMEYVEPAETYAMYAEPALDPKFVSAVKTSNRDLLNSLGPERVFRYPFADLRASANILSSLALGLTTRGYRLILAPLGPKPFMFLSFLFATEHPDVDVWRVSAGASGRPYDRPALGEVLTCKTVFGS